jgi:hypothetical protein
LDQTGLLNKIFTSVNSIDLGRKELATDGKEHEGRLFYESGISLAMTSFQEAQATADCKLLILAEETFLQQELHYCEDDDSITLSSLTQAIQSFEDSLRSLTVVDDKALYQAAEATYSTTKNRIQGCPRDIFHQACDGHRTRIGNSLRTPGIRKIEKAVMQQRITNIRTAKTSYIDKQKIVLTK